MVLDWVPADGDAILNASNLPLDAGEFSSVNTKTGEANSYHFTSASISLCVGNGRVFGTFSGEMEKDGGAQGNGPDEINVSKGQYNVAIAGP